jgi:hypothetical protein
VGHSIGAWFIQEMLKARALARRVGVFMLFPTISEIARSPSGKILSVRSGCSLPTVSHLNIPAAHLPSSLAARRCVSLHARITHTPLDPPPHHVFLARNPAAFTMANDEMKTVLELDVSFLREFSDKVWFNYAEMDDWVSGQREVVLRALRGTPAEAHVVHGRSDIPHGFCISEFSLVFFCQVEGAPFLDQVIAPR